MLKKSEGNLIHTRQFDVFVEYARIFDVALEREKLNKEIVKLEIEIANGERQLNNTGFTAKAPSHVVDGLKKQVDEKKQRLDKLRRDLDGLGG